MNAANWQFNFVAFVLANLLIILALFILKKWYSKAKKMRKETQNSLFWSGSIRLFIEAYVELCLAAVLNLRTMKWPDGL